MHYPKRKHIRLKNYDYSREGYYSITIQTYGNKAVLSTVGRGLAPAAEGTKNAQIHLSPLGEIVENQLLDLPNRYGNVLIDKYVIMPTHIHLIICLTNKTAGASPRPTVSDIICTFKSLTTRLCNQKNNIKGEKLFQTGFYEHIIRNELDYKEACEYIEQNPAKWLEFKLLKGE